jgi:hypothetical protein
MRRFIAVVAVGAGLAAPAAASAQQDTNPATLPPPTATTPAATAPGATTTAPPVATSAPPATAIAPPVATTAPPATAAAPPPTTAPPQTAAQPTTEPGHDRAAVLLLFVAGALALFLLALWALARWQAWDPPWLARWRHATGEAGWRAGNAWAEFTDWLRIGR